jgi:hypothetical protein
MASSKLRTGFVRYRNDTLDNKAREIIQGLTGNVNFASPEPPLADLEAALLAYQDALAQASKGGMERTAVKNERRKELEVLLKRLAVYVEDIARGNEAALLSSGFDLAKVPEPIGILARPAKVKVSSGPVPGSVKVIADGVPGADAYLFECTPAPHSEASVWDKQAGTARTFIFTNLIRAREYTFRVAGVGANPMRVYSDAVSIIVQ